MTWQLRTLVGTYFRINQPKYKLASIYIRTAGTFPNFFPTIYDIYLLYKITIVGFLIIFEKNLI